MKNSNLKRFSVKQKVYSIAIFLSLIICTLLGLFYREPNAFLLIVLSTSESIWQKDLLLEATEKVEPYYSFEYFDFNWTVFSFSLIFLFVAILFLIKKRFDEV